MNDPQIIEFTAFIGSRRLASGSLDQVALAAKKAIDRGTQQPVLIYNDQTGRAIDIDSRGIGSRLAPSPVVHRLRFENWWRARGAPTKRSTKAAAARRRRITSCRP